MGATQQRIETLSEKQVIEVLNEIYAKLFSEIDYHAVSACGKQASESDIVFFANLSDDKKRHETKSSDVSSIARSLLLNMADNHEYALLIETTIDEVESSAHLSVVGAIIAVGLLVNLTLLVATTEIKYDNGKITLVKHRASTDLVKTVLEPVKVLADKT